MSVQILETKEIILGEDDDLIVDVHDEEGNSLAAMTGTLGIVSSAGATTLAAGTAMTSSAHPTGGTSYRRLTYTLTSGAAQTITAVGEYMATYIATLGSKNYYFVQAIRVVSAPSLSTGYPDVDDVVDRLAEIGVTAPSNRTVQAIINASIRAWEHATGYTPFLNAASTTSTRYFPVTNGIIDFKGGIIAVPTTLTAGGYYNESGVYTGGTARVVGRDYLLKPDNALLESRPYTYAIAPGWYDTEKSPLVAVLAPFGYCSTLPDDVWEAILEESTLRVSALDAANTSSDSGAQKLKQGPIEIDYGSGNSSLTSLQLMSRLSQMVVGYYRRVRIA